MWLPKCELCIKTHLANSYVAKRLFLFKRIRLTVPSYSSIWPSDFNMASSQCGLYPYTPSIPLEVAAIILYSALCGILTFRMIYVRGWAGIFFCLGALGTWCGHKISDSFTEHDQHNCLATQRACSQTAIEQLMQLNRYCCYWGQLWSCCPSTWFRQSLPEYLKQRSSAGFQFHGNRRFILAWTQSWWHFNLWEG